MTEGELMPHQTSEQRVLKLIDFLSAYDAQRHPAVHDIAVENLYRLDEKSLPIGDGVRLTPSVETWLSVEFVTLPSTPRPEGAAAQGITGEIGPFEAPSLVQFEDFSESPEDPSPEELRRQRESIEAARRWIEIVWEPWARAYRQAQRTKALYRNLFEQEARVANERDIVELVWGFGMLHWDTEGGTRISHPLLAIPVEISIDDTDQTLRVRPEGALELQIQCLDDVEVRDRQGLLAVRDALANNQDDPWADDTSDLFRRIARMLHEDGALKSETDHPPGSPYIETNWVLYLRHRRPDYQGFLNALRDLYRSGAQVPPALSALVAEHPSDVLGTKIPRVDDLSISTSGASSVDNEPLLLPLPANEEQIRILEMAQARPGVTVQGPPGTGKTHTIANLISHYVAYGKRVLVVAEKEQALLRVTEKVPEQIRDLTVSVLGTDEHGRRLLGGAINRIQDRVSATDRTSTDAEIRRLTEEFEELNRRVAAVSDQLLKTRQREVQPLPGLWPVGTDPTPQKVAAWLAEHELSVGYIPDALRIEDNCPITPSELSEMCRLVESIGIDRAADATLRLPELERLPRASEAARLLRRRDELQMKLLDASPEVIDWAKIDETPIEERQMLLNDVQLEASRLLAAEKDWQARIVSQVKDALLRQEWERFVEILAQQREQVISVRGDTSSHEIRLPDPAPQDLGDQLAEAHKLLSSKGSIGPFRGSIKRALGTCSVDGHEPRTVREVELCQETLQIRQLRTKMMLRWNNQLDPIGGPTCKTAQPEVELQESLETVTVLLGATRRWAELQARLSQIGVKSPEEPTSDAALRLAHLCDLMVLRDEERLAQTEIQNILTYLDTTAASSDASPLASAMSQAIRDATTERYGELREQVSVLSEVAGKATRLLQLRSKLSSAAPLWTEQILREPARAYDPQHLDTAWRWRQQETWLAQQLAGPPASELQTQLERLSVARRRVVTDLVGHRAWRRVAGNLGDRERSALTRYLRAVSRFGKTGGKYAARWLSEMRHALDDSKTAVPVWIMTTSRALTNFRPEVDPPFDVLIIDEASQAGFEAIPLFSLARKCIIVGDDKQTLGVSI